MMEARAAILAGPGAHPYPWRLRAWLLRQLLPHRGRLALAASALRLYQRLGPGRWLPPLRPLEALLPPLPARPFPSYSTRPGQGSHAVGWPSPPEGLTVEPQSGPTRRRVALFAGCVMPWLYSGVHAATVRLLARSGCGVLAPAGQTCCGALLLHSGDVATARRLARRNTDLFLGLEIDAVVVNAAGCGSALKEYPHLLRDDPAYYAKAQRFSALVKDVSELLLESPFDLPLRPLPLRATYQDPCHLAHAQGLRAQPRALLRAIPGLELVEMAGADRCCGSAGIYNLLHPALARRLLRSKVEAIRATEAQVVVTANPGCQLQLAAGLKLWGVPGRVVHLVELLDEALIGGANARSP